MEEIPNQESSLCYQLADVRSSDAKLVGMDFPFLLVKRFVYF